MLRNLPEARDMAENNSAIRLMPGHQVRRLQQVAVALFAEALHAWDITPVQYAVLATLEQHASVSQTVLSTLIAYDRATIGGVIDRLDAKGWLSRTLDPADRRLRLLCLTPAGIDVLKHLHPLVQEVQERFLAPLRADERHRFEDLCLKLLRHHAPRSAA